MSHGSAINEGEELCVFRQLRARAEQSPDAVALEAPGHAPLTYGRLLSHVAEVVDRLNAIGLGRNDRVAIVLPNGPEMAVAFLAAAAGVTAAPFNPAYRANEFDYYLSDLNAKALVVQSGIDSPSRAVARQRGIPIIELTPVPGAGAGIFSLESSESAGCTTGGYAQPGDVALVLHTSGTTSRPKIVPLTHANICISSHNIRVALELDASDHCLNVMPLFHIHGLIGAMLSTLMAGGSMVCTPGFYAPEFFKWLDDFRPTWYTAVPTMHQAILARAAPKQHIINAGRLRFIRSCSASLPPKLMEELESVFKAPVIEAYGMTEAAHQMASNPLPPRKRKPGSVGVATGQEVAIMNEAGALLPPGETGEIVIRGPNVMHGYENNPAANKTAFTSGWFRTGDQGYMDPEGYIFITGRLKEIINRAGEKISPREVDEALMDHPSIVQAVAFAVPDPKLGEDVGAAVVLREDVSITEREIREFAAGRLADFKVPRYVVITDEIPKGPTGKLQRIGLAERLGVKAYEPDAAGARLPFTAPRTQTEKALAQIWAEVLGLDSVSIHDNFFELGGGSMMAARMFAHIVRRFGKSLLLGILFEAGTVEKLSRMIDEEDWAPRWSSLVAIQPGGANRPFFCVHSPSGNVLGFTDLARHLGPDQPFYGLQAQGLDGKRPPLTRVEDMAAHYLKEVRLVQPEGPYFLGGRSSTGGMVAYEMAQQLIAQGQKVTPLVLIDVPTARALRRSASKRQKNFNSLLRYPRRNLERYARNIRNLLSTMFDPQARRFQKVREANNLARDCYAPKPYPGRVVLFLSKGRHEWARYDPYAKFGWAELATGGLQLHVVQGDHFNMLLEPFVSEVAQHLKSHLTEVKQDG